MHQLETLVKDPRVAALGDMEFNHFQVNPKLWRGQLNTLKWALNARVPVKPIVMHVMGA